MAANSSAVYDPENAASADWIELYNGTNAEMNLGGYYLTDNISDTTKWMIPLNTIIPANGFLLFWADGTNLGLHTSYSLTSVGEEIGLYDAAQNLLDQWLYAAQETNISSGRSLDGAADWVLFSESTPGSSNNLSTPYQGITYHQPAFSQTGGFFDAPLAVELSTLGGTIYYTLDGRAPTQNDILYTQPIAFDSSTFIRARVFQDGLIPGPVVTHSYFFDPTFQERNLPVVSLVTNPEYFWDPTIGIYAQDFKPDWEQPLNIELFENDGNNQAVFNQLAGVKINGLYSWQLPQKMLGIYFRNEYGAGSLDYPLFQDKDRNSYGEFMLRASGSDWSFTLFRDGLCQSLIQENASVHKQGFRPSIVFINGEYMGVHNIRSRSNGEDIEQTYGYDPGTYDVINNDGEIEDGNDIQYQYMDSVFNTDLTVPENYQLLSDIVDLTNFTDYWITEMWASNSSWGHNVRMWKPLDGGKWQFIYGDLDRGFVGSTDESISAFSIPQGDEYDYARYWFQHILLNEDYASFFAQRFTDHIYTTFHPVRVNKKIDVFHNRIANEVPYHVERWAGTTSSYGDGITSVAFWENEVQNLKQFAEERQDFMLADLQSTFSLDEMVSLNTGNLPNEGGKILLNEFHVPETPWNGPYFTNMPFELTAVPNPGYNFVGWSAIETSMIFDLGESWKYLDNGTQPDASWSQINFDDITWSAGNGELGYGDNDETTTVSYGPDANNKYITTYFRKEFQFTGDDSNPVSCVLNIRRDDGVVAYLNGTEILRNNMPEGTIDFSTQALSSISGAGESALNEFLLELPLITGSNTIAFEIHQADAQSSDISFDASLSATLPSTTVLSTVAVLPVTLTEGAGYIARYIPSGACVLPDTIDTNTTLTIDCSPYLASGDTYILPNISLTVHPGVEIWFPAEARLIVQGDLQVNGTSAQGVTFKANTNYGAQSWGNVSFENSTAINHLNYLEIKDATTGWHPIHNRAAISAWYSELVLDHVTLTEVLDNPIFGEYSSFTLTNSLLQSDVSGDLINVKYGESYISDCTFIGNYQPDTDAIDYDRVTNGVIRNSVVKNLFGFNSDGVDLGEACVNVLVENCLITDCTDKGISIGQSSTVLVKNNTIVDCNLGMGIKDLGDVTVDHVTFYSNFTGIACFEKNAGLGGGFATVTNSIISNSSNSPLSADEFSSIEATTCFYDTDTMPGSGNVWMDPIFENPTNYDFHLQSNSSAIGAASDGENMGTLNYLFAAPPKIMFSDIQYYHILEPNQEYIKILNSGNQMLDISNYSVSDGVEFVFPQGILIAPGEKIMLVKDQSLFSGETGQIFQWTSGQLNNTGEPLLLKEEHGIIIDYVLYDNVAPWPVIDSLDEYITLVSPALDNHFATSWVSSMVPIYVENINGYWVSVFPNPASSNLYFVSDQAIRSIQIYDIAGRCVLQHNQSALTVDLDIRVLQPGIYLASLNGEQGIRFVVER
jgi:parallel beta-helix repeat protein